MKNSTLLLISLFLLGFMISGCVSKKKFMALQADYNNMVELYQQDKIDLAKNKTRIESLEDQIDAERTRNATLQRSLDKCMNQNTQGNTNISKLVDEINSSNKYIQHLVNTKNKSDSLNVVLTNKLTRSLSREELRDVDIQVLKGVVYISLADNMLYKSGNYEISDAAGDILSKIAKIILDYHDYDVLIEGNTDDVPISRPNIRNNWDLSNLRAASVVIELQNKYGINPQRLTAGGRGEYNPITSNETESGRSRNRRTQIIITPKLDQFMELIDQAPDGMTERNY